MLVRTHHLGYLVGVLLFHLFQYLLDLGTFAWHGFRMSESSGFYFVEIGELGEKIAQIC